MIENTFSNIQVSLNIPGTKVMACAALIMEEYKPLVEQALEEIRQDLRFDASFQKAVKEAIKEKTKLVIEERIKAAVNDVIRQSFWDKFGDIETTVRDILLKEINHY